jgi:hypothetical protein
MKRMVFIKKTHRPLSAAAAVRDPKAARGCTAKSALLPPVEII